MGGLDWDGAVKDIKGACDYLKSLGCTKVGILGFCMGGALTIASICKYESFSAAAPFYGIPDLKYNDVSKIKCPVFAYFAEKD
jgi:carboxymethylenebutenolidase